MNYVFLFFLFMALGWIAITWPLQFLALIAAGAIFAAIAYMATG